jgi:hypothetical protein
VAHNCLILAIVGSHHAGLRMVMQEQTKDASTRGLGASIMPEPGVGLALALGGRAL